MAKMLPLILSVLIAQAAGLIGSVFTAASIPTWYATLLKPEWGPPNWLFAPVWTTLYLLMGVAAYLVWQQRAEPGAGTALWLYGVQLVLNTLWSVIFFGLRNTGIAFVEILVLLVAILATAVLFWRVRPLAGGLMIPYLLWVSFAAILNFRIWQLN